jgi:colanic acid/amylovoran biosynthesis glycosyltransferase
MGLNDFVHLLGPQPQFEVRRKLSQASVLAAPCILASDGDRDGLPTVLLEAMAMGTPVVSTDVTGIPEILEDGVTGLAVPQRDSSALALACQKLLEDAALRKKLSLSARALVESRFDIRQNSKELRRVFTRVLEQRTT